MKDNLITYKEAAELLGYKNVQTMRNSIYKGYLKLTRYEKKRKLIKKGDSLVMFDRDEVMKVKKERDDNNLIVK